MTARRAAATMIAVPWREVCPLPPDAKDPAGCRLGTRAPGGGDVRRVLVLPLLLIPGARR